MWIWDRAFDEKSDSAGSIMHRPLCVRAAGETALDLMRLAPEVTRIQGINARVGILYSMASMVYQENYPEELKNSYEALNFTGNRIAFVHTDRLLDGNSIPEVLLVPMATHIEERAIEGILKYIEGGGMVILLGDGCLQRNEHDLEIDRLPNDPERIVELTVDQEPVKLRKALLDYLPAPSVHPKLADGTLAWGIEWLEVEESNRHLVNAVNLLKSDLEVSWTCEDKCRMFDLLSGHDLEEISILKSLNPVLLELTRD
jgi:hypothetical protein